MIHVPNDELEDPTAVAQRLGEFVIDVLQSVRVEDGYIVAIEPFTESSAARYTTIDGKNGYLLPGLAEMHAHVPSKRQGEQYTRDVFALFLANGVTTIRGMLGEPWHLELREAVNAGHWDGPRLITSGPSFNGSTVSTPARSPGVASKRVIFRPRLPPRTDRQPPQAPRRPAPRTPR